MSGLFKPGQKLRNGEIEIIDQLGYGSTSEVYRVSMLMNAQSQIMVLKCFNSRSLERSGFEAIEMVHRESAVVSKIQHSGIVHIHLIDLESSTPFIIEEYLPGGDLKDMISERKRSLAQQKMVFTPAEIAHIGMQISTALMILHQNNVYHGDLKPHNLCFRQKDALEVVIVDFGHAGFLEGNLLDRNENLATLAYLPPERTGFVNLAGNASSDLYSLGITLYECAIGVTPFSGLHGTDLINRLLYEVPKPLHEVFPDFPLPLSDIISKLLRKDPRDRYHSAFGLAADLERCCGALKADRELVPFALGTKDKLRELNYRIPMVGRQKEVDELYRLFEQAQAGGSSLVLIGAPSGFGKSRLAFEALNKAQQHKALVSYVKFSEYERNLPLGAVSILLTEHCHYLKTLSSDELAAWGHKISDRIGDRLHLIVERYPFYAAFFPRPRPRPLAIGTSQPGFQVFNETLGEFLGLLSAKGECQFLFIDDLQWADWQSLQVLGILGEMIFSDRAPGIMLMGTFRSNEIDADHPLISTFLDHAQQFTLLELGPLEQPDSNLLVEMLLDEKSDEVSHLQDTCYRFSLGNPFYVYEYLKSAIHTGIFALNEQTQTWHFNPERIHIADLSSGVAGLVVERIRTLNEIQQALISITSLAGQAMKRTALQQLGT
ncbi:MAG TPA: protein kinase [Oligoflexus sp.]|uniref:protein kinase domain-containing protein n=1 Tax=Oligoflexus sp. TaxID=1971216 RepID=UPI002D51C33E|nr:protein kinase [Oligoflexus sp.]HYX33349.1 protein kinase [Oligoflexus sp.]